MPAHATEGWWNRGDCARPADQGTESGTGSAKKAGRATPTADEPTEVKPERTPTRSAEPAPTVDPHPALEHLVIATTGLGPLTVGSIPPADNPGAAMIEWDADACADTAEENPEIGRWTSSGYGEDTGYTGDPVVPFAVDASDAGVHRIDVLGSSPATAEGIHIRSTLDGLRATYPSLTGPVAGPGSQVWILQDASGSVAFETQGDADGLRPPGTVESVILIRILAPGYPADFATANSGDVAGACVL
ncbi:hypothetical protein [Cellulomonas sp. KRMCY2]|uniref:hypothetical protein n=1 Tax=Cellulomonas sp. KRMCY2 TaxID=1304865 RepID=UPI00045E61B7|nr:hypothetical protein [Cellulomonas sp. KRMCY2]